MRRSIFLVQHERTPAAIEALAGTSDPANVTFASAVSMTAESTYTAGRSIQFSCTAAASVTVTLATAGSLTFNLPITSNGPVILPYAATAWT